MRKFLVLSVLFSYFLAGLNPTCFAQRDDSRILPIEEFIELAAQNDTVFQVILIDELTLQYKKALEIPAKDLVLSVTGQYSLFLDTDEKDTEGSVSLTKLFPFTGTEVSAEYSASVAKSTHKTGSDYSFLISQSIAENAFGKATRLLDRIVGIEIDIAKHQIIEAYEDYLTSLIQRYCEWYSAYENLKTAENSYRENVKLLDNIKERQKNNIALPIDVNKIQLQVLAKEENLVALRNKYSQYCNLIKEAIRSEEKAGLQPKLPILYDSIMITFLKDYKDFQNKSRTYNVLKMLKDKSSLEVEESADGLLPSINLFAGFSVEGEGYDVRSDEKKAVAGVSFDFPFPGQVERAEYETAKIDRDKTELTIEGTYARLYTNLKNLYEQIERQKKLIALAEEKIALAEAIVKDETENYTYGKVTLNDLIDEVNKLEDNKFNKISQVVQLKKLTVEWLRLTDQLVTRNKINTLTPSGVESRE